MSKARIIADYAGTGATTDLATQAELDTVSTVANAALPTTTAASTYAPLASPAFTGTPTGITAAHLEAGVLPSDVTGGSGLNALGTVATGTFEGTLNTSTAFPAGHVLRTFYNESDALTQTFNGSTDTYWDELDLSIPASSTSDYLIITLNINGLLSAGSGAFTYLGLAYSTNSWSGQSQLGTSGYYDRPAYLSADATIVVSSTVVIRVNHPTASSYNIRPKITPSGGNVNINQSNVRSTILAIEVKG